MIIMALDHVREYVHFDSFLSSPTDLRQTNVALFATRWITHICAPHIYTVAGTSVYLMGKKKDRSDVAFFLITRGLWLIVVQFTIVRFAWNFDPLLRYNSFSIISAIGFSMIALSALVYLPLESNPCNRTCISDWTQPARWNQFAPGTIAEGSGRSSMFQKFFCLAIASYHNKVPGSSMDRCDCTWILPWTTI